MTCRWTATGQQCRMPLLAQACDNTLPGSACGTGLGNIVLAVADPCTSVRAAIAIPGGKVVQGTLERGEDGCQLLRFRGLSLLPSQLGENPAIVIQLTYGDACPSMAELCGGQTCTFAFSDPYRLRCPVSTTSTQ